MTNHDAGASAADLKNTFLTPAEVFLRYRWGRTKGYQMLRAPGFPRSVGGAYRLDTLAAWEEDQLAGGKAETGADPVAETAAQPAAQTGAGHRTATATPAEAATTPGDTAAWSPSTRRPAAAHGSALTSGGK
jgi:hypothetical protein